MANLGRIRLTVLSPLGRRAARTANGDDRHGGECIECGYYDTLLKASVGRRLSVVELISDHIRHDHEPVG